MFYIQFDGFDKSGLERMIELDNINLGLKNVFPFGSFFFNIVFLWLHDSKSRPHVNYIVIYLGTVGMVWVERKCSIRGCITMNTIANFGTLLLYTARFSQTHCMCVPPPHTRTCTPIHTHIHTHSQLPRSEKNPTGPECLQNLL